jgi:hypothetical protein
MYKEIIITFIQHIKAVKSVFILKYDQITCWQKLKQILLMIKFFRKSRKKLLSVNKIGNYLLYAVGEISLIVVGIILALWLNNWNKDKDNRETEQVLLQGLKTEFVYNLEKIKEVKDGIKEIKNANDILLRHTGLPVDSLFGLNIDSLVGITTLFAVLVPSDHALSDAQYSGKLDLIQNGNLRIELFQWTSEVNELKSMLKSYASTIDNKYLPFLNKHLSYKTMDYHTGWQSDPSRIETTIKTYELMNIIEFENFLSLIDYNLASITEVFETIEILVNSIIEKTDKSLAKQF